MVVLNDSINLSLKRLKIYLPATIKEFMDQALEHYIDEKKLEKIKKNMEKYIKEKIVEDHFVYLNMDENICTHKFKRGKKEGNYCCKKIRTNLEGNSRDYLCTKHSKKHIPKKRIKNNSSLISFSKNNNHKKNNFLNEKNKKKILKKNLRKNKSLNIFLGNNGVINFKHILSRLIEFT